MGSSTGEPPRGTGGEAPARRVTRRFGPWVDAVDLLTDNGEGDRRLVKLRVPGPLGVILSRRGGAEAAEGRYWHGGGTANRTFTGAGGEVVQAVRYGPYGEILEETGTDAGGAADPGPVDFLWNGGERLDGSSLTRLGPRLYDPATGRFLQRDPLLLPGTGASRAHPYAFAWNDPVNHADPSGLSPQVDCPSGGCDSGTAASAISLGIWAVGFTLNELFGGAGAAGPAPVPLQGSGPSGVPSTPLAGGTAATPPAVSSTQALRAVTSSKVAGFGKAVGLYKLVAPDQSVLSRVEGGIGFLDAHASLLASGFESSKLFAAAGRLRAFSGVVGYLTVPWELAKGVANQRIAAVEMIKREAFLEGAAAGAAAAAGGRSWRWTKRQFWLRGGLGKGSLVEESLFTRSHLEPAMNNRGLIVGYEAGRELSAEERIAFVLSQLRRAHLAGRVGATLGSPWRRGRLREELVWAVAGTYSNVLAESFGAK